MTTHELAALLLAFPDIGVMTEGCDCYGEPTGVVLQEPANLLSSHPSGEYALITRG